ncbi:unnamed protein product [Rhizoctonia solani]|uniref:Uncharacterized protein n=1 Tax=Rhizoctonia solani TaxID=456999 RepID=A0A8H3C7D1_9AGAM|nr:unnamed protein product [Rhizoctonia solani]
MPLSSSEPSGSSESQPHQPPWSSQRSNDSDMSLRVQRRMSLDCNAKFVMYSLLSEFGSLTEKERDATRFVLGLIPSCVNGSRRLVKVPMTNDAYTLAQLYLPELQVMASRHSYVQRGPLKNSKQAQALLSVIVSPLVCHLSSEERKQILGSIGDVEALLSNPLDILSELVGAWKIRHLELVTNWRSLPIAGVDRYYFGVKLPVPLTLEELLAPLPYPPKSPRATWNRTVGYEKAPNRYMKLPPRDQRTLPQKPMDFQLATRSAPSRLDKKSELKALDLRYQYFVLPDLARTSSDSSSSSSSTNTNDSGSASLGGNSDSHLFADEGFEESTWDLVEDWSELQLRSGQGKNIRSMGRELRISGGDCCGGGSARDFVYD